MEVKYELRKREGEKMRKREGLGVHRQENDRLLDHQSFIFYSCFLGRILVNKLSQ